MADVVRVNVSIPATLAARIDVAKEKGLWPWGTTSAACTHGIEKMLEVVVAEKIRKLKASIAKMELEQENLQEHMEMVQRMIR